MTTPELNLLTELNADTVRYLSSERAIIFIGNFDAERDAFNAGWKCLFAQNFQDAVQMIKQLMRSFPRYAVLIVYKYEAADEARLSAWQQLFKVHPEMRSIPFFLYADNISMVERDCIRKYCFIDEVINAEGLNSNLYQKVAFINKYKKLTAAAPAPVVSKLPDVKPMRIGYMLKRSFDILVAAVLILLASPLFLLIAVLIKLESKGPVFYAARRAGKNCQIFKFYKFRTMVANADKQLQQVSHLNQYDTGTKAVFLKISNDPRVTRLGSFLRNTSLDEIPQLFNVLIGNMSLVGNRPLPLYEATALTTDECAQRFLAPAGITGLWQVSKRGKKEMSASERIELDINYSLKHSFTLDMWIMINTPKALVQKDNV